MLLAPFLEKSSLDRAPGRFADYLFVPKHAKADVLLTTVWGPLRWGSKLWHSQTHPRRHAALPPTVELPYMRCG